MRKEERGDKGRHTLERSDFVLYIEIISNVDRSRISPFSRPMNLGLA